MKTKCLSVRIKSLVDMSDKAFRVTDFNGNSDIIPKSTVFGEDYDVSKSEAYWIAAWILEKKSIVFSNAKVAWFDEKGKMLPTYTIQRHKPDRVEPVSSNEIEELKK